MLLVQAFMKRVMLPSTLHCACLPKMSIVGGRFALYSQCHHRGWWKPLAFRRSKDFAKWSASLGDIFFMGLR